MLEKVSPGIAFGKNKIARVFDNDFGVLFNGYETELFANKKLLLNNISSINFFVGANNSGKSRFLRAFMNAMHQITQQHRTEYRIDVTANLMRFFEQRHNFLDAEKGKVKLNISSVLKTIGASHDTRVSVSDGDILSCLQISEKIASNKLKLLDHNSKELTPERDSHKIHLFDELTNLVKTNIHNINNNLIHRSFSKTSFVYIPTLRTSINLFDSVNDPQNNQNRSNITYDTIISNYFNKTPVIIPLSNERNHNNGLYQIFTGSRLYEKIKQNLLGEQKFRDQIADYQNFLSEFIFDNKQVTLIPKHKGIIQEDHTLFVNIDGIDRELYNVGDGVQSLIIATYPMFMSKNNVFFIEEPEQNLHPGYQRKFVEILEYFHKTNGHTFFCTTHSNHFLDKVFETKKISIYNFQKQNDKFKISSASQDSRLPLNLLGVQNSSVFLSNCIIWVEGPSDRLYFKKFIEILIENNPKYSNIIGKLKEGIHYCFSLSGGSLVPNFDFSQLLDDEQLNSLDGAGDEVKGIANELKDRYIPVRYLCGRSMVIVDNDNSSTKKDSQKEKLKKELLDDYYCYEGVIELENLLPYKGIIKAIKLNSKSSSWKNIDNSEFNVVKQSKIKQKRLGSLIITDILPSSSNPLYQDKKRDSFKQSNQSKNRKGGAALNSGLKMEFANIIYDHLEYSDFDECYEEYEAFIIGERIIDFILKHNSELIA